MASQVRTESGVESYHQHHDYGDTAGGGASCPVAATAARGAGAGESARMAERVAGRGLFCGGVGMAGSVAERDP